LSSGEPMRAIRCCGKRYRKTMCVEFNESAYKGDLDASVLKSWKKHISDEDEKEKFPPRLGAW